MLSYGKRPKEGARTGRKGYTRLSVGSGAKKTGLSGRECVDGLLKSRMRGGKTGQFDDYNVGRGAKNSKKNHLKKPGQEKRAP